MVAMSETSKRRTALSRSSEPDLVEELMQLTALAGDAAGAVRESAGKGAEQVKKKASEISKAIAGTVKEEAERLFDEQKGKAASTATRYGKTIKQAGHALRAVKAEGLAEYADSAAGAVEGLTQYLEERNLAQVLEDAGEVARRHPGMVIGGMFLTGFALARFLKASEQREGEEGSEEEGGEEEEPSRGASRRR